jgi:hypothetical protein
VVDDASQGNSTTPEEAALANHLHLELAAWQQRWATFEILVSGPQLRLHHLEAARQLLLQWDLAARNTTTSSSFGSNSSASNMAIAPLGLSCLATGGLEGQDCKSMGHPLLLLLQHGLLRQDIYQQIHASSSFRNIAAVTGLGSPREELQHVSFEDGSLVSSTGGTAGAAACNDREQLMLYELLIASCRSATHTAVLQGLRSAADEEQQLEVKLQGWTEMLAALQLQLNGERVQGCFVILGLEELLRKLTGLKQQLVEVQGLPACAAVRQQWGELVDLVAWAILGSEVSKGFYCLCCLH